MGYDRGDGFSFDFEQNGNLFSSKSEGKLSPRPYPIQFGNKWSASFLLVSFPRSNISDAEQSLTMAAVFALPKRRGTG